MPKPKPESEIGEGTRITIRAAMRSGKVKFLDDIPGWEILTEPMQNFLYYRLTSPSDEAALRDVDRSPSSLIYWRKGDGVYKIFREVHDVIKKRAYAIDPNNLSDIRKRAITKLAYLQEVSKGTKEDTDLANMYLNTIKELGKILKEEGPVTSASKKATRKQAFDAIDTSELEPIPSEPRNDWPDEVRDMDIEGTIVQSNAFGEAVKAGELRLQQSNDDNGEVEDNGIT